MSTTLSLYRASKLLPFFVMYVNRECPSPSFALINQETFWNTRSLKVYLLEHNTPVPEGQFNDTSIRVPTPTKLCPKKNCPCPKTHLQKLGKKDIFHIAVEEKTNGAETTLRSIMCRDGSFTQQTGYTVFHVPKTQISFVTTFNDRRASIRGDMRIFY